jgi:hypothetical protein
MNTNLEEMYKYVFAEYENVTAAKGCNQYKHISRCPDVNGDSNLNDNKTSAKKPKGEKFTSIRGELVDSVAKAIKNNKPVYSNGFSFSTIQRSNIEPPDIPLISQDEMSSYRKLHLSHNTNPWQLAESFVRVKGKRLYAEKFDEN